MGTEVVTYEEIVGNYDPDSNITAPLITKYELAKIIGQRMQQLANGASTLVDLSSIKHDGPVNHEVFKMIVDEELKAKNIPFMLCRTLPNNKKEYWKIKDMIIPGY